MIDNDTLNAIVAIADERDRQLKVKGWTRKHDDGHNAGELAQAAAFYALWAAGLREQARRHYPWNYPETMEGETQKTALIKAAALCVAELERFNRIDAAREPQVLSGCAVRAAIQQEAMSPPTVPPRIPTVHSSEQMRRQFMAAIDYAIEVAGTSGCGAGESFLRDWREGDVSAWPEFKGPVSW